MGWEWIISLLVINFIGGYLLGITALFLWQRTGGLQEWPHEHLLIKVLCLIFWPIALWSVQLWPGSSEWFERYYFECVGSRPIWRLNSKFYLGIMVCIGFFPKVISLMLGLAITIFKLFFFSLYLLGGLLKPSCY